MRKALPTLLGFYVFCFLLGHFVGRLAVMLLPLPIALPTAIVIVLAGAYAGGKVIACGWKQATVDFILLCWPIMPIRFKVWAFLNDGDL